MHKISYNSTALDVAREIWGSDIGDYKYKYLLGCEDVHSSYLPSSILMKEAADFFETFVYAYQTIRCHIPEYSALHVCWWYILPYTTSFFCERECNWSSFRQMAVVVTKQSGSKGVPIVESAMQSCTLPITSTFWLRTFKINGVNIRWNCNFILSV